MPCHKARAGYLFKQPVVPGVARPRFVAWQSAVPFAHDDTATLKYHADGFAEFSADKLGDMAASRDVVSGEAKGLGLFSASLARPPVMGATLAIIVYGLDQFDIAKEQNGLVVLGASDFYYRKCLPRNANSWTLGIYVFPKDVVPPVRIDRDRSTLAVTQPLNPPMSSVLELKTISLTEERITIGLCVIRSIEKFQSTSGWVFHGPGDYSPTHRGHVLMGIYPQTEIPRDVEDSPQQRLNS